MGALPGLRVPHSRLPLPKAKANARTRGSVSYSTGQLEAKVWLQVWILEF